MAHIYVKQQLAVISIKHRRKQFCWASERKSILLWSSVSSCGMLAVSAGKGAVEGAVEEAAAIEEV